MVIPLAGYWLLRRRLDRLDAAAVAATYGSISAVTFITASQALDLAGIAYGGHMAAAMTLMESPAIIIAIVLANKARSPREGRHASLGKVLHESFTDGGQLLLLGSLLIGLVTGEAGYKALAPFSIDLFKGLLAFFLLDMGLMAARSLGQIRGKPPVALAYALMAPPVHAAFALAICRLAELPVGDTILLMVLAASASYIAVPAVLRQALPEVNPALYLGMSLGITFPLNILGGIPLYTAVALWLMPATP